MKNKIIYVVLLLPLLVLPLNVKADTDVITNKIIQNTYPIDSNDDGKLSQSEVSSFNGTLFLENKNLTSEDINELSKFIKVNSKKYYYKVRAYKVVDGKTYYGSYSDIVSITYNYVQDNE
jgi:hypothetical protein